MKNENNLKLYHYCSIQTLLSIVKNENIWFSDLKNSNDYLEEELIFEMFKNYLKSKFSTTKFNNMVVNLNHQELIKAKNQTSIYGLCLTANGDNILPWMTYGRENSVCLELDYNELLNYFSKIKIFDNQEAIQILKVQYVFENSKKILNDFNTFLKQNDNLIYNCYEDLIKLSIKTKLNSWKPEKEYSMTSR